jgi:hypothetical protein
MYLAVKDVVPVKDYQLILTFENGEKRKFDMRPYLNTVHLSFDTVEWNNEADLDPEDLYKYSESITE